MALAVIALIFTLFGRLTGSNLSEEQRKIRTLKFALIGAAIFFFAVPIFKPMIFFDVGNKISGRDKGRRTYDTQANYEARKNTGAANRNFERGRA